MFKDQRLVFIGYLSIFIGLMFLADQSKLHITHQKDSARHPAAQISDLACVDMVSNMISSRGQLLTKKLAALNLSKKTEAKVVKIIKSYNLKENQLDALVDNFKNVPNDTQSLKRLDNFIEYSQTLFIFNREKFLKNSAVLFSDDFSTNKELKAFRKRLKVFTAHDEKEIDKIAKRLRQEEPDLSVKQSLKRAKVLGEEKITSWKKLYNGCHTKGLTQEHKQGAKFFTYFTVSIAAGSSGVFYTASNWDEEDFGSKDFYGKLSYEMVGDALWALLASYVFKDPTGTFLAKSVKLYLADNLLIMADGFTWEQLFGDGEDEAKKRIEQLKANPEFQKELLKLAKHLERDKFVDKVGKKFSSLLERVQNNPPPKEIAIDWENITAADLEDEEINNALMQAALTELYEGDTGQMSTGSYGADRWAFYSAMGLPFMFLDTAISAKIYHTMCMAPANPKKAVLVSAMIFTAYSIFYDTIAYPMRKQLINQ